MSPGMIIENADQCAIENLGSISAAVIRGAIDDLLLEKIRLDVGERSPAPHGCRASVLCRNIL